MKIRNLVLGLSLLLSTIAFAQEKGDFNGFAGLSYPLASGADLGATAGVEYVFAENISAAPSFTYYFSGNGVTTTQLDIDARYYMGDDSFNWFVTAGLSMFNSSVTVAGNKISANTTGFAAGAGALFSLGETIDLLAVVKYNSEVAGGGILPTVGVSFGF